MRAAMASACCRIGPRPSRRRAGGAQVFAGEEPRLERPREQVGEVALREFGADVGAVACFLE